MRAQRLRVTFSRGNELRYITHLDMMRFWERALRRAEVDIAYSEGFSPHPQISLAAPLSVGVTARAELMDVFLARQSSPTIFLDAIRPQLPPGLAITNVEEIDLGLPSIQSQLCGAAYEVRISEEIDSERLRADIEALLARDTLPWKHVREKDVKSYDLRPLILDLALVHGAQGRALQMRLRAGNEASGRPDQVMAALGLPPNLMIERTGLILMDAYSSDAAAVESQAPSS
jgi:radical SAM-linked protein